MHADPGPGWSFAQPARQGGDRDRRASGIGSAIDSTFAAKGVTVALLDVQAAYCASKAAVIGLTRAWPPSGPGAA